VTKYYKLNKKLNSVLVAVSLYMVFAIVVLLSLGPHPVEASNSPATVVIDGQIMTFNVAPQTIEGRILVPMWGVFEKLGASVEWIAAEQKVVAYKPGKKIELKIGSSTALVREELL